MNYTAKCPHPVFTVRQKGTVEIELKADGAVTPTNRLEVQFPNSWCLVSGPSFTRDLQTEHPDRPHFISVSAPTCPGARFDVSIEKCHLNHPDGPARHGRRIRAALQQGVLPAGTPIHIRYANTFAPYVTESEFVWIRMDGRPPQHPPRLDVQGGPHRRFRVLAPSGVKPGQIFDVLLISLDDYDNPSSTPFTEARLEREDGTPVAGPFAFSGVIRIPTCLDQPGIHRFVFREARSNAVRVAVQAAGPFWGDLHIHSKLSMDAQGTDPYLYAREVSGLDFAAVTDHCESLGPEGYRQVVEWSRTAHQPGSFVTFPADERNPPELRGHHNLYVTDESRLLENASLPGPSEPGDSPPNSFARLARLTADQALLIPHHTGIIFGAYTPGNPHSCAIDWTAQDDRGLRPVMEIYSHHGQSESYAPGHLLAYEWNRLRNPERRANTSVPGPYYAQDYWMQGAKVGVIGSSDEHSGQGGRAHGGLAAVWSPELTRPALFKALRERACYATTGERILVDFHINDLPMGQAGTAEPGQKLTIHLALWGTAPLLRVEILRFRRGIDTGFQPIHSIFPPGSAWDYAVRLEEPFTGPVIYYARVLQEPLEWPGMAWTSPIWFDPR